jgi:cystathionine beta-lyase/cystathionine gamma-synthase
MANMITRGVETPPGEDWVSLGIIQSSPLGLIWAESHLARLYGAYSAFALSTGMTCLDMILRLVKPGETVLAGDDIYGGTNRLLTYLSTHGGVDVQHLDTTRPELLLPHLTEGNK